MKTQYQVVAQWVEGHFVSLYPPIDSLEEAIKLRETYGNGDSTLIADNIFITKIKSWVMTEEEINKEK